MRMAAPLEIGISCKDLDAMVDFYTGLLGCRLVNVIDMPAAKAKDIPLARAGYRVARLQTPHGERIKLLQPVAHRVPVRETGDVLLREHAFFLTFIVEDLDALLARLKAAGARMLTGYEKTETRPGFHLAFAADPEGNVLELTQYDDLAGYRPDLHR